jgi:hypothetical protein
MGSVLDQLDAEWRRIAADPVAAQHLGEACRAAGEVATLGEVEQFVRASEPAEADRVLVALAALAVEGDDLAARVLLQLLLPGARRLARTWWALGDADEREAAAVAATYDRIKHYPLARRPRRIAANILMDAASDLRRAARATQGPATTADLTDLLHGWAHAPPSPHPDLELVDALTDAVGRGLVSPGDAELIAVSRIGGTSLREIARRRGAKLRTLQWRRKRAEALLAAAGTPSLQ